VENSLLKKTEDKNKRPGVIEDRNSITDSEGDEQDRAGIDGPYRGAQSPRSSSRRQSGSDEDDGVESHRLTITRAAEEALLAAVERINDGFRGGKVNRNQVAIWALVRFGATLGEDEIREIPGRPVAEWKVHGKTAIPAGRYRITLEASSVSVSAMYLARESGSAIVGPNVELFAGVVYGTIGNKLNTLTLDTYSLLLATGTGPIALPSYSRRVSFASRTPGAVLTVAFYGDALKAVPDFVTSVSANVPVDIPNGMEAFSLDYPGPAAFAVVTPIVELAL
jgi:hypothetical protein